MAKAWFWPVASGKAYSTLAACVVLVVVFGQRVVHAQTLATWSGTSGATWDTSATNWTNVSGAPWDTTNGQNNRAVFNLFSGTANVSGMISTNAITAFSSSGTSNLATIVGGTISLVGTTPSIVLASGNLFYGPTISSALAGTNGLTLSSSAGTVRWVSLQGNNSGLSGDIRVGAGVSLYVRASNTALGAGDVYLDSSTAGVVVDGRTVANNFHIQGRQADISGSLQLRSSAGVNGSVELLAHSSISAFSGTSTLAGVLYGSSQYTLTFEPLAFDTSAIKLSAANTFSGTTTFAATARASAAGLLLSHSNALQNSTLASLGVSATFSQVRFDSAVAGGVFTLGGLSASSGTLQLQNNAVTPAAISLRVGNNGSSTTFSGALAGPGSLTKIGSGTLTLAGANTFTGQTAVGEGALSLTRVDALQNTAGVSIAGGAGLGYTGGTALFDKDITVTSGTGTVTNSGGGTLTLGGTLTKNGTVLRLTGGRFNVTGQIVGSSSNSDLVVDAAAVTLSNTNSYNGPTFVYNSGTLTLAVNNAIPNTSVVTLGDATTRGTLVAGTFTDSIGQLVFSGSGGIVSLSGDKTASAQLATNGSLTLGSNANLVLTNAGTTAGLYRLISATAISGSFGSITGTTAGYQVISSATSIDYQQKAVLGALTVTNTVASIITGGSAAFTYSVANAALSGGASLAFTGTGLSNVMGSSSGSALGEGSSGPVGGLFFTGTAIGAGQIGTFTVNAADAYGTTTTTGTVSLNVLDHATSSLGASLLTSNTISLGTWNYATQAWESGGNSYGFSIYNIASSFGVGLTADLSLVGVSGSANGFSTNLNTYLDIAGGSSRGYLVFADTSAWNSPGMQTATFTIQMSDKTGMEGATASNTLALTANVIVVPEPDTLALCAGSVVACIAVARRRMSPQSKRLGFS